MSAGLRLFLAAQNGDEKVAKELIAHCDSSILAFAKPDEYDMTPLHCAAKWGQTAVMKILIKAGAKVNARDKGGCTPLHWAAQMGHEDCAKLLLSHGATQSPNSMNLWTPLHKAVHYARASTVSLLIQKGARTDTANADGDLPLHCAAWSGANDILELLINVARCDPNAQNRIGATPLHIACTRGRPDVVDFLIEHGANMFMKDTNGRIPLELAIEIGFIEIIQVMEFHKVKCKRFVDKDGNTALHLAALHGHTDLVRYFKRLGCSTNKKNKEGRSAIDAAKWAAEWRSVTMLEELMQDSEDEDVSSSDDDEAPTDTRERIAMGEPKDTSEAKEALESKVTSLTSRGVIDTPKVGVTFDLAPPKLPIEAAPGTESAASETRLP